MEGIKLKKNFLMIQFVVVIMTILFLNGCLKGEQDLKQSVSNELTPTNESVENIEDEDTNNASNEEGTANNNDDQNSNEVIMKEMIERTLYLVDADGMVVPQTLSIPKDESKEVAKQVLTYLIKDGPVTDYLPSGFQAVIPANTEINGVNIKDDGTLIIDVSEDFTNYKAEDELKIIEAMTYSLTQFESVNKIKLRIDGEDLSEMPVNGTPISTGYSKEHGINVTIDEQPNLLYSKPVTIYYPKSKFNQKYFVPMTQYVTQQDDNVYGQIVQALLDGPSTFLQTQQVFNDDTMLVRKPMYQKGVLELEFNENILSNVEKSVISEDVMETLARTFTGQEHINAINVKVENRSIIHNENGQTYDEPVTMNEFSKTSET